MNEEINRTPHIVVYSTRQIVQTRKREREGEWEGEKKDQWSKMREEESIYMNIALVLFLLFETRINL